MSKNEKLIETIIKYIKFQILVDKIKKSKTS